MGDELVDDEHSYESDNDCNSDENSDDEEKLVELCIIDCNSDKNAERDKANEKMRNYVEFNKSLQQSDEKEAEKESGDQMGDDVYEGSNLRHDSKSGKVIGYESDCIPSSNPGSYEDTSAGSDVEEARRRRSTKQIFDLSKPMEDFSLDLRFKDLKLFKK